VHNRDIRRQETAWTSKFIWKDIIILNLKEILREVVTWINLAEDKGQWQVFVNKVIRGRVS
jgi:hypothetical protein